VLLYKSWIETRWRFLIGLALLMLSACAIVMFYHEAVKALSRVPQMDGELGRRVSESAALARDYRGYVWSQWFRQNMRQLWALFAVLLGTGGLLAQASRGGALFTLSLPVSRSRVLGIRAATALSELAVLAIVPSLLLPLLSPAVGETYSLGDALVHGACMFIAGSVLFSFAFLLSTVFSDIWRPPLIVLCLAVLLRLVEQALGLERISLLAVMTAERYFHGDGVPWLGLLASATLSAGLLYAATVNIARQDF
jgi:hypothetical protein